MIKDRCCARPVVRRYIPFSPPTRKKKAKHLAAQACLLRITFTRLFDYEPPPPPTRSASRRLVALWNSTTCIYEFFFSFFSIYNLRRSPSNWFIIHLNFFSIQRGGRRRRGTWSLSLAIAGCWLSSRESFSLFLPLTLPLMWWTTRIIQLKTNLQRRRRRKNFSSSSPSIACSSRPKRCTKVSGACAPGQQQHKTTIHLNDYTKGDVRQGSFHRKPALSV